MKERIQVLMMISFADTVRIYQEVCNVFNENHPARPVITRSTVRKWIIVRVYGRRITQKLTTKSVSRYYAEHCTRNSQYSLGSHYYNSVALAEKILQVKKYHPYDVQLVHYLLEEDFHHWVQFCNLLKICLFTFKKT